MSKTKQIILLLDGLEKNEFDKIVKIYLQKEYGYNSIVFTDGKDDTGIDIKIFDFEGQKIQYQLTTQKSKSKSEQVAFARKVLEDLEKARLNHQEYGYRDKLVFFYSKTLTNAKIREFEKAAFKEYGINLEIIEGNRLAEEAENIIEIQAELYQISELDRFHADNSQFENNLFFDLLSFGRPTEFKSQVIDSFVLQLFYLNDSLTKEQIINECQKQFNVNENSAFYERLLNRFQADKKVSKNRLNNTYRLTQNERDILKKQNDQFDLDKEIFVRGVNDILKEHDQDKNINEYVIELKRLYVDNFNTDLTDVISNETEFQISSIFKPFVKFIEQKLKSKHKAKTLSIQLLKYCLSNKFIQKVAATKVYSSKIANTRLQKYINIRKRIFVDTAIGIYGMCYFYKPKSEYGNFFYKATKGLIEYAKSEESKLYISERYIWEIVNHVKEAFRIIPFTKIKNFVTLGSSRNVFYNYYIHLVQSKEIDQQKTFTDFIADFGFFENASRESYNSIIEHSLSNVNILKQKIQDYEIEETNLLFENAMIKLFKNKTNFARNCDSIMLEFLADTDVDVHPVDPIFLTWDKTFFEVQPKYRRKFPNSQNWLMLTPNKFVDIHALLRFSINSETVTENLLALISDDIITNTHSLVDTLTFILNPNDEVGLEYTSRLAEIREREINQINNSEILQPENYEGEAVIDDLFFNLTNYYKDDVNKLDEFRDLFTKKEYIDDVIRLLLNAVSNFYEKKEIDKSLYANFDHLISLSRNQSVKR